MCQPTRSRTRTSELCTVLAYRSSGAAQAYSYSREWDRVENRNQPLFKCTDGAIDRTVWYDGSYSIVGCSLSWHTVVGWKKPKGLLCEILCTEVQRTPN